MRLLKNIQRLTLSTVLILALSACSSKESNDTNSTEPTAGTTQGGGTVSGTGVGSTETTGVGGTQASGNTGGSGSAASQTDTPSNASGTSDTHTNQTTQNDNTDNTANNDEEATTTDSNSGTSTDTTQNNTTQNDNNNSHTDSNATSDNDSNTETNATTDVTPPVITLNGQTNITLQQNTAYTELGATAVDAVDGNLTVAISGTVNTSTVGEYTLTYTATDSAGNEANVTRNVEVVNTAPALTSLTLESNATTLNVDDTVQLTLKGTYSDGSSGTIDENITYTLHPTDNAEVNGSVLRAKKDGNVTIQAKVGNTLSNTIALNITWVVDGHVLPPEPDKTLNDSTLLGVDSNDNGVRDDVERWIYEEYKDKHPIYIDIAMQAARGYKLVLETPEKAKEIYFYATAYLDCKSYYSTYAKYFKEPILIKNDSGVGEYFRSKIYFNTLEREAVYNQYDNLLSGDSYSLPKIEDLKALCDFNTSKYKE